MNEPSLADWLLWDSLPFELRTSLERLFGEPKPRYLADQEGYARGYRAGFNAQLPDDLKIRRIK